MPVDTRRFVLDMLILHDFWAFVSYNRSTMVYANAMVFVWNCRFFELPSQKTPPAKQRDCRFAGGVSIQFFCLSLTSLCCAMWHQLPVE